MKGARMHRQSGLTLVVSLIMLVVLTLLVVSAIRFGNINLRIAGNAQATAEETTAAQVGIEQTLQQVSTGTVDMSALPQTTKTVSTGGKTYNVTVAKPNCNFTKDVDRTTLDPTKPGDRVCFGNTDSDPQVNTDGTLTRTNPACKDQQWDVSATVADPASNNTNVTMLEGVSLRVGPEVSCP